MSLVDNAQDVAFTTRWPTDKIVGVWEGSYNRATDVVARNFTSAGSPFTVYFYRIPHGFTRPVFTDLLWSIDGSTFSDGGAGSLAGESSISLSDDTYIYLFDSPGAPAAGTAHYKVIASWIDDYDATNPLVPRFNQSEKDVVFDTRVNYQKIIDQDVSEFSTDDTQHILHDLNRRPNFKVFFESFENEVWPMHSASVFTFDDDQTECRAVMSDLSLAIQMINVPGTRRAWHKIYLDQ